MKIVAIIQARMRSSRLPGKVLAEIIEGKTALELMIWRVKAIPSIDRIVVATSDKADDKQIADLALKIGVGAFRGSEANVLDRYYQCATKEGADIVVRFTADCPLIDPDVSERTIQKLVNNLDKYQYVTNGYPPTWPDGMDTEAFTIETLKKFWEIGSDDSQKEHVTPLAWKHPSGLYPMGAPEGWSFRMGNFAAERDYSDYRLTLDELEDLELVRQIYKKLYTGSEIVFSVREVIDFLDKNPQIAAINKNHLRNEGYLINLADHVEAPLRAHSLKKSRELYARAKKIIPCATQTLSKGPTQFVQGVAPIYLQRGDGCRVFDVDGNEYLDYSMALGPILLGYNHPEVNEAVTKQVQEGPCFSLMHPLEVEVSELLVSQIPYAEMVRFGKNGSDVTAAAVRLARACTGKERVAHCGYHGWQDWYIGHLQKNGVPECVVNLQHPFIFNNLDSLTKLFKSYPGEFAAVIMEAQAATPPEPGFLESVKELAHQNGALLIFDEICNGFRVAYAGAGELYNVYPDLGCYGKGIANGYPVSALVGREKYMRQLEDVFFSFTFGGETVSLAAAKATIEFVVENGVLAHLKDLGLKLCKATDLLIDKHGLNEIAGTVGLPARGSLIFSASDGNDELSVKSLFQQECIKRGLLFTGSQTICYAHNLDDLAFTLKVYDEAFNVLKEALASASLERKLEGEKVRPVFRPTN